MTALVSAGNWRVCLANSAPSTAIVNTASETVFDQYYTFPSQMQHSTQPPTAVRMRAFGIYSTGLVNLGLTLNIRWGGISGTLLCSSGSLNLLASASSVGWSAECVLLIQAIGQSGQMEGQGYAQFTAGALSVSAIPMANAGAFTVDTTVAQDFVLTAQWATASPSNSIQMRTCVIDINGP